MSNTAILSLDMVNIVEHIRTQSNKAAGPEKNWAELADKIEMNAARLRYFAINPGSAPAPKDLTKLMAYFMPGYVMAPASLVASSTRAA